MIYKFTKNTRMKTINSVSRILLGFFLLAFAKLPAQSLQNPLWPFAPNYVVGINAFNQTVHPPSSKN